MEEPEKKRRSRKRNSPKGGGGTGGGGAGGGSGILNEFKVIKFSAAARGEEKESNLPQINFFVLNDLFSLAATSSLF